MVREPYVSMGWWPRSAAWVRTMLASVHSIGILLGPSILGYSSRVTDMASRIGLAALHRLFAILPLVALPSYGGEALAAGWPMFGGNAQHTGLATRNAQALKVIHWSPPVDEAPPVGNIRL